jgi:hypothetical protein
VSARGPAKTPGPRAILGLDVITNIKSTEARMSKFFLHQVFAKEDFSMVAAFVS